MKTAMTTIGVLLFMLGACAMDSKSIVIPVIMTFAGLAITAFSMPNEI